MISSINVLSHYSLLESTLSIDDIINFSINNNLKYAILTDKNFFGVNEFYDKCQKNNIKPIIGLNIEYENSNLILIAKNNDSYLKLFRISSMLSFDRSFDLKEYLNDFFIIKLSGDIDFKSNNFYTKENLNIHTSEYLKQEDYQLYRTIRAIKNNEKINELDLNVENNDNFNFLDIKEVDDKNFDHIIENVNLIIEKNKEIHFPKFPNPDNIDSDTYLKRIVFSGLIKKLNLRDKNLIPEEYLKRINYELETIKTIKFADYFLVVNDFCQYASNNNILLGPGRGSSASSLVSFALNITEIDPIPNNLFFERFLNLERKNLPDIDIDVADNKRSELIKYIFDKYGIENCSYIINFQRIKSKMAIRDVGRVLDIDLSIIDRISKNIPLDKSLNDLILKNKNFIKDYQEYKLLFDLAMKLVDKPRQFSTHPAGIIISDKKIDNYIPIIKGIDDFPLSQFSMNYLEDNGLIKIDILGLKNLTIINDIIEKINEKNTNKIDLKKFDLNDKKVFNELKKGNTKGIFQLESPGMNQVLMNLKPNNLEEISLVIALYRPGPMKFIKDLIAVRNNKKPIFFIDKSIESILKYTYGFCVYQEQVIQLVKTVANFSNTEADIFRRAISKKEESVVNSLKSKFIKSSIANNYTDNEANQIFNFIVDFANYGFNHAHSLSYALISYWVIYLKVHYPLEFFSVLLANIDNDDSKVIKYINDAKTYNIKIKNISINDSDLSYSLKNGAIYLGFNSIKGFGYEISKKIIDIRGLKENNTFVSFEDAISSLYSNKISQKSIEILIRIGAFENFDVDENFLLVNFKEIIDKYGIIDTKTKLPLFDIVYNEDYLKMPIIEKEQYQIKYLSMSFMKSNLEKYFDELKVTNKKLFTISSDEHKNFMYYLALVKISKIKKLVTKFGKEMAFITVSDLSGTHDLSCFEPSLINKLEDKSTYLIEIKNSDRGASLKNIIREIKTED